MLPNTGFPSMFSYLLNLLSTNLEWCASVFSLSCPLWLWGQVAVSTVSTWEAPKEVESKKECIKSKSVWRVLKSKCPFHYPLGKQIFRIQKQIPVDHFITKSSLHFNSNLNADICDNKFIIYNKKYVFQKYKIVFYILNL